MVVETIDTCILAAHFGNVEVGDPLCGGLDFIHCVHHRLFLVAHTQFAGGPFVE